MTTTTTQIYSQPRGFLPSSILADKLGARLVAERTKARLYLQLLARLTSRGSFGGGPSRDELVEIRHHAHEHYLLLQRIVTELEGDSTTATHGAELESVLGRGAVEIIGDPRRSLLDALEAIAAVELADVDRWQGLIELAELHGHPDIAEHFQAALDTQRDNLRSLRRWIACGQGRRQLGKFPRQASVG